MKPLGGKETFHRVSCAWGQLQHSSRSVERGYLLRQQGLKKLSRGKSKGHSRKGTNVKRRTPSFGGLQKDNGKTLTEKDFRKGLIGHKTDGKKKLRRTSDKWRLSDTKKQMIEKRDSSPALYREGKKVGSVWLSIGNN